MFVRLVPSEGALARGGGWGDFGYLRVAMVECMFRWPIGADAVVIFRGRLQL